MAAVPPCLSRCGQKSKVARGRVGSVGIAAGCAGDCGTVERDVNRDGLTDDAGCRLRCGCGFLFGLALGSLFLFEVTLGAEVLKYPVRPSLVPGGALAPWLFLGAPTAFATASAKFGRRRYTLQTSTAPPSTVMDVPVAIGCCIAYT